MKVTRIQSTFAICLLLGAHGTQATNPDAARGICFPGSTPAWQAVQTAQLLQIIILLDLCRPAVENNTKPTGTTWTPPGIPGYTEAKAVLVKWPDVQPNRYQQPEPTDRSIPRKTERNNLGFAPTKKTNPRHTKKHK